MRIDAPGRQRRVWQIQNKGGVAKKAQSWLAAISILVCPKKLEEENGF